MRLSLTTLLAFTLSVFSFFSSHVSAIHPQVLSRREHPSSSLILSSRQHRLPRSILDLCINANVDLLANASQHGLAPVLGPLALGSNIHLCLCLKDLNIFLDTNADIIALVGLLGKNTVSALITALINTSPDASQCSIPPHAHQTCNSHDSCHYECDPHYVRVGDMCVCTPPYTSCNGECDIFPKGCGTAVPRSFKARSPPITTITQAKAICKPHETVCGIPGRENTFDFECIDINTAGDSCGGCMAPHPFPQADPILHVFGTDCTRIPNAKNSECSGQHCVVSKCNLGWHPNLARDTCILNASGPSNLNLRNFLKREDSLTANVVANANISSDLVANIGAIVSLVSGLEDTPSQILASSSSSAAVISSLLGDIADGTSTLIAATDVPSLLNNLDALLNVSSLLSSTISSCGCGMDLGLTDLADALGNIAATLLNFKSWFSHNVPSDLDLSGLLSGLSLNNSTLAAVVSSDLVDQIKSLVSLVVGLAGVSSSLPPPPTSPSNLSSINTNIINSIINATVYIVNATTVPSLVSSIGALVNTSGFASSLLDHCGCVSALGLGTFVADLAQVVKAALRMREWCDTYPVANISAIGSSSTGASTSNSNTDELFIDLGLSNLLGLLGPVERGVVVSGTGANTLANGGLTGGLLISTGDVRRQITADADASLTSELLSKIESLVSTVLTLVGVTLPAPVVDSSVIDNVLRTTEALLRVSTAGIIEPELNGLVAASLASVKTLDNCDCVDNSGLASTYDSLVQIAEASLDLQDWCHGHSILVSPSSSSLPVNSNSYGQLSTTTTNTVKEPVIVGLTNLWHEYEIRVLGLDDASLSDAMLDSFGFGPNELRRRVTREL